MTTSVSNEVKPGADLAHLAERINAAHAAAETALRAGLDHARTAGELLVQAKAQLGHGQWLPWLERNVCFSLRTAQAYMRVARRWQELEAKAQALALLTFEQGLELLAEPAADEPAAVTLPPLPLDVNKRYSCKIEGTTPPCPLAYYSRELDLGRITPEDYEKVQGTFWDESARGEAPPVTGIVEIMLLPDNPDYAWVGWHMSEDWDNDGDRFVDYTGRGIRTTGLARYLDNRGDPMFGGLRLVGEWHVVPRTDDVPWYVAEDDREYRERYEQLAQERNKATA
jgi:hypothetical protein